MAATVFKRSHGFYYLRLFSTQQEIWLSLRTKNRMQASSVRLSSMAVWHPLHFT